ncbi:MAG: allophanate hydrolase [Hyphomicrobium sp.]
MSHSLDISYLADGYAKGAFTPADIVAQVYDAIAARGERPVWISLVPRAEALAKAKEAPRGPLYGVPFAVKDNIDVQGLATTCACPQFAYVPERSATLVERLEAAGAILIGKTNMDQFATGLVGTRSPYGIPACVFDERYVSGGSSSGSAVAVAAGLVSFSLGTDTAGSGRVPAAFNNIVGLKPTKGALSARGVVPACRTLDTVSIFALTTADAGKVFDVAAGFDAEDAYSRPEPASVRRFGGDLRVGVPRARLEFCGDEVAAKMYADAIARARSLGAQIVEIDFEPFQLTAKLLYQGPWVAERLAAIADFARKEPESIHEVVRGIILGAEKYSATDTFQGLYRLADLVRAAEGEWGKMDMLLLPTTPTIYTIEDVLADPVRLNSNLGLYTNFVNLMDLSALAVPAGFGPTGLPYGVTLLARAFEDRSLQSFADAMHRALGDISLGKTAQPLKATPAVAADGASNKGRISVAVVGAHLSGQPLNTQLTERAAKLLRTARTAPGYAFYALSGTKPAKPGLVFDGKSQGKIEVEIWEMDEAAFGSFVALIPAPLGIGTLTLDDGSVVKGFVCEAHAVKDATDITAHGGWRAYLASAHV